MAYQNDPYGWGTSTSGGRWKPRPVTSTWRGSTTRSSRGSPRRLQQPRTSPEERAMEMQEEGLDRRARWGIQAQLATAPTGPTWPRIEGARGEFRAGMGSMLGRRGMETAYGELRPLATEGIETARGRPAMTSVRGTITRQLSPDYIEGERGRLMTEGRASVRAAESREMRRLEDASAEMTPAQQRRYARQIRDTYAEMMASLPLEVDRQISERTATTLGQGVQYGLGQYGAEMQTLDRLLAESGRFGLTPDQEAAMRMALMEMAGKQTVGPESTTPRQSTRRWTPMGSNLTGGGTTYRGSTRLRGHF